MRGGFRRRMTREIRRRAFFAAAACASAGMFDHTAWGGQFTISNASNGTIDTAAWVGESVGSNPAPFGRAMNGNSFETNTITTFDGYQYTAYWKDVSNTGRVAIARRQIGTSTWQSMTLTPSFRSAANATDAHDVISLGIDPKDGTIHLAFDMHSQSFRYLESAVGLATNPGAVTWSTANAGTNFPNAEQSTLGGGGSISLSTVTYPMFVQTPGNDLQLFIRTGSSGQGSFLEFNYNGTTHGWDTGHQIDNGLVDNYVGTTSTSGATRNDYPNGFTYGSDGNLYHTFTYRENATGAANHDLLYVYSPDGGITWLNNAGATVGSETAGTQFHLNSPGLVVRPLPESQTNMNQQGQAVDHHNYIHAIGWHRDSAKDPSLDHVWEPEESSYYDDWRDSLGNWHEDRIPGDVGSRPKIFFDANDNAIAIYQVKSDTPGLVGGTGTNGNLYFQNGDLVISAATKASNWTDWKVIKIENGPFVSEVQADAQLLASNGTLSVIMQNSPTPSQTGNVGTSLRTLDYSISLTAPTTATFSAANGNWNTGGVGGNWGGSAVPGTNTVVNINSGHTATVNSSVPLLDNVLAIGSAGSAGTLNVGTGATLTLLQTSTATLSGDTTGANKATYTTPFGGSIVVGRDSGSVGTYIQTGGVVSAWRFAVGDYMSETSGGGVSSATISGGSLSTYELDVAFSDNGSSSGSSFNVNGGSVAVHGDVILGEFGNTGSLTLTGGTLTIDGDIREGFNQTNTSYFRMDGGTLDMGGGSLDGGATGVSPGYVTVDNFIYNGGTILNVSTAPMGTNLNTTAAATFSAMTVGTALIGRDLGVGSTTTLTIPAGVRMGASKQVEVWSGGSLALGSGAAVAIGTTPSFTSNQVNVIAGGTLAGDGMVAAAVNNSAGVIDPGHASVGTLHFNSTYVQGASGSTRIDLGSTGNDELSITGTATLAGTLRVTNFGGFIPLPGQAFTVMTFASKSGDVTLDDEVGPNLAGLILTKSYTARSLLLTASAEFNGDANLNGAVDISDFNALAGNFGASGANWLQGDFNGDGVVNLLDLNALATNFGSGTSGAPALGALVPEPSLGLMLLVVPALLRRARRR
jgi:BNR repeat-containing family member